MSRAHPTPADTPDWRPSSVLPLLSVAADEGASDFDPAADVLLRLSSPEQQVVLSRYHDDPVLDYFVNGWLLQQPLVEDNMAIRDYAYFLDAQDPVGLCGMADTWGKPVTVLTRKGGWQRRLTDLLAEECPSTDLTVELVR